MRVTLLLLALLVAGAFAQLPTGSIRCNATLCGPFPAVQCTLCADGTLGGCYQDACIVNDAGGCSWYRRPPCSSTPAPGSLGTTKPPCSDLGCNNTCPYGRVSINGCITCTCAPAPPQCLIACTDPSCNLDTQVYVPPGPDACCGTCKNKPSGCSVCPSISCPPSTATTTYGISVDACGCKTCVALDCSGVVCPDPKCVAPQVAFRTADGCCPVCRTPPTCPSTACPALACADGYHSIVRDGDCCPSCVPNPPPICPDCVLPTCAQGTRLTQVPGTCCPVCLPAADCTAILCPATTVASLTNSSDAACNPIFLSNREGACCKVCSPCRRNEAGLIRCDVNDQPVCAPGIATGDGNTCTPVPNPNIQQACKEFTVTIKQSDATVGLFAAVTGDNDQNRRIAKYALLKLILANAPAAVQQAVQDALEHLSVTILGRDGDQVRIKVCWTAATGDSTVDTTALATSTEQALTTAGVQTAGAAVIVPAVLLIFAAAIAML